MQTVKQHPIQIKPGLVEVRVMLPESQLKKRMLMLDVKVLRTFNINETGL